VRKVVEKNNGSLIEERIYLGGYEIFRQRNSNGVKLQRETLHIMDDKRRIALVETKTVDESATIQSPTSLIRYQLSNHLGSASLELDAAGEIISYEEYYPYGSTSYQAVPSQTEVPLKRYRYTGKERDEETGLYYHGARYYAPWLGRWTAADPAGLVEGMNAYVYVRNTPINLRDPDGGRSTPGLSVSPQSGISAREWVAMIKRSQKLEPWMKNFFDVEGNRIVIRLPTTDELPKGFSFERDAPKWFFNAVHAIKSGNWHLTTGAITISEHSRNIEKKLIPDFDPGDRWVGVGRGPQESTVLGLTVPGQDWVNEHGQAQDQPKLEVRLRMPHSTARGNENPQYRRPFGDGQPTQGLIVVGNRVRNKADDNINVVIGKEDALLETFFHELGAHAGLASGGKFEESEHSDLYWRSGLAVRKADELAIEVRKFFGNPSRDSEIRSARMFTAQGRRELIHEPLERYMREFKNIRARLLELSRKAWQEASPAERQDYLRWVGRQR